MRSLERNPGNRSFLVIEGGRRLPDSASEDEIEARLERFAHSVEQFVETLPAALLSEHAVSREILEELIVKQSALHWIVRVAKSSRGEVRKRLWSDINDSLAGLERTFALLPRLQAIASRTRTDQETSSPAASFLGS
jgi:hypothetical protein